MGSNDDNAISIATNSSSGMSLMKNTRSFPFGITGVWLRQHSGTVEAAFFVLEAALRARSTLRGCVCYIFEGRTFSHQYFVLLFFFQ